MNSNLAVLKNKKLLLVLKLFISALLTICILVFLYTKMSKETVISNTNFINNRTLLAGWTSVTQKFVADQDRLDKIVIAYEWENKVDSHRNKKSAAVGEANYTLEDASGHILASGHIVRQQVISARVYLRISFTPIMNSKNRIFVLKISMNKNKQILGLFAEQKSKPQNQIRINGKTTNYELAAEYYYNSSHLIVNLKAGPEKKVLLCSVLVAVLSIFLLSFLILNYLLLR